MPDEPDDDLVPPMKVMRKRLNGVYRADSGFSGPTRRYVVMVALLVGLASVPTLAAITAGSNELADGRTDTMDVPFLPPTSPGPVRSPGSATSSGSATSPRPSVPSLPSDAARTGAPVRVSPPAFASRSPLPSGMASPSGRDESDDISYGDRRFRPAYPAGPALDPVEPPADPVEPAPDPVDPAPGAAEPDPVRRPGLARRDPSWADWPVCHERGACGVHPAHHQRPDHSRRSRCGNRTVHPDPAPAKSTVDKTRAEYVVRSIVKHRFRDRSKHSRRSAMTERPHNIRAASILERSYAGGYNSRRPIPDARGEGEQITNRAYRGSHRAGGLHLADDQSRAEQRSSRVGRHHADRHDDYFNRR